MLQLNVDFSLLNKFFGVSFSALSNQYANKDLEEIMEIEAKQGNPKAAQYKSILSDSNKLIEIFKLASVENKFLILQNMSERDLDDLLPYLNQEQLSLGLQFFTDEKLLEMSQHLPIEELVGMIFQKFSLDDVLALMPVLSMDKFLSEPDVEREYSEKYFARLSDEEMEKIMLSVYGGEMKGKSSEEYMEYITELNDGDYKSFLSSLRREDKMGVVGGIIAQEEELLLLFQPNDLIAPMELLMKEDKIKMMKKLDPEFLVPMIQELPMDLTQIVLTQIDPRDFSEILSRDFQDILSSVVLFSSGS